MEENLVSPKTTGAFFQPRPRPRPRLGTSMRETSCAILLHAHFAGRSTRQR